MPGTKSPQSGMINTVDDLLASTTGMEPITIVIKAGTVDANSPEGTAVLRKGLVLTKHTSGADAEKFSNHASGDATGLEDESNAVVLKQSIDMGDQSKDVTAAAYFRATLHADKLIVDDEGNFDWSTVQRLRRL